MGAPLFILSFRHRDELYRLAERAGWQPIAARRADNAEARFIASGASVAVVDARGALAEGQEAVRALADAAEANAAALLVLLSRSDARGARRASTSRRHPFPGQPVQRGRSSSTRSISPTAMPSGSAAAGRAGRDGGAGRGSRLLALAARLAHRRAEPGARARKAGLGEEEGRRISLMELFRKLDPDGRRAARGAIDRLLATGEATAFAHGDAAAARGSPTMSGSSDGGGGRPDRGDRPRSGRRAAATR